ncbi:barnase inhibitor [Bacillus sp. AFS015802]|uniref:barstar family protein n=1 Tax=Bacillus sp. AFS015802 TaxID=2033486 RepID=UPI000BF76CC5|nr:barstar family protein [Bacillus sp. AFS015802]PFA62932.1 barnase inhibitor [Bacillus sp. AFS015802]
MNKVIINGEDFHTMQEFHKYIKRKLDLPDYYGENLNALWDCLTGFTQFPLLLVWENFDMSKAHIGEDAEKILQLFKEVQGELEGDFIFEEK